MLRKHWFKFYLNRYTAKSKNDGHVLGFEWVQREWWEYAA